MSIGCNVHANGIRQQLNRYPGINSLATTWGSVSERLSEHFDVHALDVRGRGLSQARDGFVTVDIDTDLPRIILPAMLDIAGGASVVLPKFESKFQRLIPHMKVRRVPEAGHLSPRDDFEEFLVAVPDFTN